MSSFIEALRTVEFEPRQAPLLEAEVCPAVLSYVTLGKPLHAGHIFLMATATLAQKGIGDAEPLILVNNNTGPRVAGALIALAESSNLPVEEAAKLATLGKIEPDSVIDAYRARNESSEGLKRSVDLLDSGKYDIFRSVVDTTRSNLSNAGFNIEVVNEASMLVQNQRVLKRVNPLWAETGFSFFAEKGLSILEKEGQVTATGKCLTSLVGAGKLRTIPGEEPFIVLVDASNDSLDAVKIYSALGFGRAALLPGAGVSFGGEIASGTAGEALSLPEMFNEFKLRCPEGDFIKALQHMVLTTPGSRTRAEIMCLYDFRDNESLVDALATSFISYQTFQEQISLLATNLEGKQSSAGRAVEKSGANKLLNFLPQRAGSLFAISNEDVIRRMSKFSPVTASISEILKQQGYQGDEIENMAEIYRSGRKELVYRDNFFFNTLQNLIKSEPQIESLTEEQFILINGMINFCMERIGYD